MRELIGEVRARLGHALTLEFRMDAAFFQQNLLKLLAFEFGEGLFLRAAAGSEVPHRLRGEGEIGRHRGVFEVTAVG